MDIQMKLCVFFDIMVCISYATFTRDKNENILLIDFSEPVIQVDIDPSLNIVIRSMEMSKWFIPEHISRSNEVIVTNGSLLITKISDTLKDISGNLSICKGINNDENVVNIYDIPACCPCCPWFYQHLCQSFYNKIENCTTIILYSWYKLKHSFLQIKIYDNSVVQLPCPMRKTKMNDDLTIFDSLSGIEYLKLENGTLTSRFSYNPTSGLCFNTSNITAVTTYLECKYAESQFSILLMKYDLSMDEIHTSLILFNGNLNQLLFNNTLLKVFPNTIIKLRCEATYKLIQKVKVLICMKFGVINNIPHDYNCSEFNGIYTNEFIINSDRIANGSKIICNTMDPTRRLSQYITTTIYKYYHERLEIRNSSYWKNKIFQIFENITLLEFTIDYYVIPSNSPISCKHTEHVPVNLKINCSTEFFEKCKCQIYTNQLFQHKFNVTLSISISNKKFNQTISMLLVPIYLNVPRVHGFTTNIEYRKVITCDVLASKPFTVQWNIKYNEEKGIYYLTKKPYTVLNLNNNTKNVCISCAANNLAGTQSSERICKRILDIDMHDNNNIQIFLENATFWSKKIQRRDLFTFLGNKSEIINILDLDSTYIKCASRIKNTNISIFFNGSKYQRIENGVEYQTEYTMQKTIKMNMTYLTTLSKPIKYYCQQLDHVDETYIIRVLKTKAPTITLYEYNNKFLIGQNIQFTIGLLSFPKSQLKLFRMAKFENNDSFSLSQVGNEKIKITQIFGNTTFAKFILVFYNFSENDSGKYVLNAINIRGEDSYSIILEPWHEVTKYVKVYILIGSLISISLLCLIFVVIYCKKTGYAIPIIQIQNNMYKSLDGESMQILSTIWPDPLERVRWTIRPSSRVKVKERIGGGNYGVVYTGTLKYPDLSEECVALKYPILTKPTKTDKPNGPTQFCQISLDCFIKEIRILSILKNCPNIIRMHGCVVLRDWINEKDGTKEPTTMVVLEFCSNRSLSEFLCKNAQLFAPYTRHRKFTLPNGYTGMKMDEGITLLDLKRIALGIATGLQYLNGLNIIHRDLATRNVLLDEKKVPKICDFGLAIELDNEYSESNSYQIITYNKALPYKILAPEALESKIFYLESDIWSFSLLLWEMFNLEKAILFPNINTPGELLRYIYDKLGGDKSEHLLSTPRYADESIWDLIRSCWMLNPFQRPSANAIHHRLVDIVRNSPAEVIRVSGSSQSETYDYNSHESVGSSEFPSTRTSIITFTFPSMSDDISNNHTSNDQFNHSNSNDESFL